MARPILRRGFYSTYYTEKEYTHYTTTKDIYTVNNKAYRAYNRMPFEALMVLKG